MITVNVQDAPAAMRAAVLAMKRADADIRKGVDARMRETMNPVWRSEVTQHLTGAGVMEGRLLTSGVRIAGGNPPQIIAASGRRRFGHGGGLVPNEDWQMYEFGSHGTKVSQITNKKGTTFNRHASRGLPAFTKTGRVLYPALAGVLPRIASFWTQSVVKVFMDAAEGKD